MGCVQLLNKFNTLRPASNVSKATTSKRKKFGERSCNEDVLVTKRVVNRGGRAKVMVGLVNKNRYLPFFSRTEKPFHLMVLVDIAHGIVRIDEHEQLHVRIQLCNNVLDRHFQIIRI